jgi:hypothetical protein
MKDILGQMDSSYAGRTACGVPVADRSAWVNHPALNCARPSSSAPTRLWSCRASFMMLITPHPGHGGRGEHTTCVSGLIICSSAGM